MLVATPVGSGPRPPAVRSCAANIRVRPRLRRSRTRPRAGRRSVPPAGRASRGDRSSVRSAPRQSRPRCKPSTRSAVSRTSDGSFAMMGAHAWRQASRPQRRPRSRPRRSRRRSRRSASTVLPGAHPTTRSSRPRDEAGQHPPRARRRPRHEVLRTRRALTFERPQRDRRRLHSRCRSRCAHHPRMCDSTVDGFTARKRAISGVARPPRRSATLEAPP